MSGVLEAKDEASRNCAVSKFADSIRTSPKDNRVYLWYESGSKGANAMNGIEQAMQIMGLEICPPETFENGQQRQLLQTTHATLIRLQQWCQDTLLSIHDAKDSDMAYFAFSGVRALLVSGFSPSTCVPLNSRDAS